MKKILLKILMSLLVCFGLTTTVLAQTVYPVVAGTDGITGAIASAVSGDIIELTTSGGEYLETASCTIVVKLTIRAKAGLAAKPVIKGGSAGTADVLIVNKGGLTLKGVKFDGGQYVINCKSLSVSQAPDLSIKIDDCVYGIYTYTTPGALVQNCIVSNLKDPTKYCYGIESGRFAGAPASTVKNSIRHKGGVHPGNAFVASIIENVDSVKPLYTNPAVGEYSLLPTSPGKNAGTDGKDLGYISKSKPTSVGLITSSSTTKVYPNPIQGLFRISLGEDITGASIVEIFDITGKIISKINVPNGQNNVEIDLSSSPAGMYFGILKCANISDSFKVIKK